MDTVSKLFGVKLPTVYKVTGVKPVACAFPKLIVGMELETENAVKGSDWYESNLRGPWTVATDGSLRGRDTAFEFISKPIELENMIPVLAHFFETTGFTKDNYSDRCSVHVHTNVTDFTQEQLATLSLVYTVIEDVLFRYVNFHKAPTEEGYCRDTNIYCIPWSQCRVNTMFVNNLLLSPVGTATHRWQKYTALNLQPIQTQGTVEWRHMHGTADMEKLTTWLNVIGSIMKFSKEASLEDVVKTIKILNDTSAYQQFFNSILQGYLQYEEEYRGPMSDGVINAKNGLFNWEINKAAPKKNAKEAKTPFGALVGRLDAMDAAVQQEAPVPQTGLRPGTRTVRGHTIRVNPANQATWNDDWILNPAQMMPDAALSELAFRDRQHERIRAGANRGLIEDDIFQGEVARAAAMQNDTQRRTRG